jgi:DNA-binding NtrC family response regulator
MFKKAKILVVDDEIHVCNSIAKALEVVDYLVDTVLSGEEALKQQDVNKYDVIITDLMMPGISGMELLKALKEKDPAVRVIMITGYPSTKSTVAAIKSGAVDYLPKPFTPGELRSAVEKIIKRT